MRLLDWVYAMIKKPDLDTERISKEIYDTHVRHDAAKRRLDDLTSIETARLRVLQIQAEVMSRKSNRG